MYTSYIGKKFLDYYKKEYQKPDDYTAERFFDEVMFPLFFDDEKHLMHVGNSPFFQKSTSIDINSYGTEAKAKYARFKSKLKDKDVGGEMLVGYGSSDLSATTSGQLSEMNIIIDREEIISSWIGQALAFGVSGGIAILIDKKELLLLLFHGWTEYRKLLKSTPSVKDRQIETWNGNYLKLKLNNSEMKISSSDLEIKETLGKIAIQTIDWSKLIFELTLKYPREIILAYCYILSQTNLTLGFINLFLPDIEEMWELKDKIFINNQDGELSDKLIDSLITQYSFRQACERGTIGLHSLEPKGLRQYMPKGSYQYSAGKELKIKDEKSKIEFYLYKLWITAMLKKSELLDLAREIAKEIKQSESKNANRGKTTESKKSEDILDSYSKKMFIEKLELILNKDNADNFRNNLLAILELPQDVFPLFITLIKFEYSYLSNKS